MSYINIISNKNARFKYPFTIFINVIDMKIGTSGSTCSGKTTFINYLQFYMEGLRNEIEIVSERALECPYPLNEKGGLRTQWWILSNHILKEIEAQKTAKVVITDRTVFDGIAYLQLAQHTNNDLDFIVKVAQEWASNNPYDYVLYFAPVTGIALSDHAQRFQAEIDKRLRTVISYNIPHNKIIYIPYDTKIKRCEFAFQVIKKILEENQ